MRLLKSERFYLVALSLVAVPLMVGCNQKVTHTLAGAVRVGSDLPDQGSVSLESEAGGPLLGGMLNQGRFRIEKVPPGKVRIRFMMNKLVGTKQLPSGGPVVNNYVNLVPADHRDGITIDVSGDRLDLMFDLKQKNP